MEHNSFSEVTIHHEPAANTKKYWKVFWILLIITVIELGLGLSMYIFENMPSWLEMAVKGVICILTLAKAFYIISVFMHLGDEIRNLIMTVAVPMMLFIWFIAAFLWDGSSFRTLRNRYMQLPEAEKLQHPPSQGDSAVHRLH
ncbi:MAG: cytochrome C oxidase subunit IV family protein [Candidatus Dadabacteria bacterium]